MSFRWRITLASAGAVAIAILFTSLLNTTLATKQLRNQTDSQLQHKGRGAQRLRAMLRRAGEGEEELALSFEDLRLDRLGREAWRGERPLHLTRTEFLLLEMFLRHPRQVLTRSQIFEHVWGYDFGATSNSLGVYMGYLRRKTELGGEPRLLHTVRGIGYVLRENA